MQTEKKTSTSHKDLIKAQFEAEIGHPGRREVFNSIYSYDPASAYRYFYLFCLPDQKRERTTQDWDQILQCLSYDRDNAITLKQMRERLAKSNPFYNYSGLARNLNYLIKVACIKRCRTEGGAYYYWKLKEDYL